MPWEGFLFSHSVSPQPRWATIAEAAAAFGVSTKTLRRMIDRGEAYAERIGPRLVRVDLGSIRPVPLISTGAAERTLRRTFKVDERIASGVDE